MTCALWFASVCLVDPSTFQVQAELSQPIQKPLHEGAWCGNTKIGHWCQGPRADLTLSMSITLPKGFRADYGLRHESYVFESDRGTESVYVRLAWSPTD
jgi:hypothetical protein